MGNSSSTPDNNDENNDNNENQTSALDDYPHPIDDSTTNNNNNYNNDNNVMIDDDPFDGSETLGYRVLGVQPNSPASAAGLVSFLDFLVGVNKQLLLGSGENLQEGQEYNDIDLPTFLMEHKNIEIEFLVFNIKSQKERLVYLTPSDTWGGAGLLGVTIRLDDYAMAEERIIRVLSIDDKNSPAAVAGLVPERDYILGTTQVSLDKTNTLAALLQQYQDLVLELYVYNVDSDLVRTVALMPTLSWGGRGLLGADVGMGYLHRLPSSVRTTDGASVERKVRYVERAVGNKNKKMTIPEAPVMTGILAETMTTTTSDGDAAAAANLGETASASNKPQQQQLRQGIFEHEPQLEMEPPEHDDEQEEHDTSPPQVSPAASAEVTAAESSPNQTSTEAATTTSTTTTPTVKDVIPPPSKAAAATTGAAAASIAAVVFSQGPPPPAPAAVASTANKNIIGTAPKMSSSSIAAAAAAAATAATGLPPPPVLHYNSPPPP